LLLESVTPLPISDTKPFDAGERSALTDFRGAE